MLRTTDLASMVGLCDRNTVAMHTIPTKHSTDHVDAYTCLTVVTNVLPCPRDPADDARCEASEAPASPDEEDEEGAHMLSHCICI